MSSQKCVGSIVDRDLSFAMPTQSLTLWNECESISSQKRRLRLRVEVEHYDMSKPRHAPLDILDILTVAE